MPEDDPTHDRLELADDFATLAVTDPTGSRPTILLAASGPGVAATVELSASGAFTLARMLRSASVRAAAALVLPDPADDPGR